MEEVKELEVIDKRVGHLVEAEPVETTTSVVLMALQKGYQPELIEKMMGLQERHEKNEARKAFYAAVADFKKNPPEVLKDKENSQFSKGERKAMYASLGSFVKSVNPALGEHGLSASWEIVQAEKIVKVTCNLSHRLGHSESVTMEAPPDTSGGNAKNPIQQIKSTITYLRSVTFEAVTGTAATDANLDDDGNLSGAGEVDFINADQIKALKEKIKNRWPGDSKADEKLREKNANTLLEYMDVETLEEIESKNFKIAMDAITPEKPK